MREVEDSPNRCPSCQRVQITNELCPECKPKSQHNQDVLDLLDILDWINDQETDVAGRAISTMRKAIKERN